MRRFAGFLLAILMVLSTFSALTAAEQLPAWQTKPITIRFLNRWAEGVDALYEPVTLAIKEFTTRESLIYSWSRIWYNHIIKS